METIIFPYEKTSTGYCAYATSHSILATGATLEALEKNALEGISAQCEFMNEEGSYPKQDASQFKVELVPFEASEEATAQ